MGWHLYSFRMLRVLPKEGLGQARKHHSCSERLEWLRLEGGS